MSRKKSAKNWGILPGVRQQSQISREWASIKCRHTKGVNNARNLGWRAIIIRNQLLGYPDSLTKFIVFVGLFVDWKCRIRWTIPVLESEYHFGRIRIPNMYPHSGFFFETEYRMRISKKKKKNRISHIRIQFSDTTPAPLARHPGRILFPPLPLLNYQYLCQYVNESNICTSSI